MVNRASLSLQHRIFDVNKSAQESGGEGKSTYDKMVTTFSYVKNNSSADVVTIVANANAQSSRREDIEVRVNGELKVFEDDRARDILCMNNSFEDFPSVAMGHLYRIAGKSILSDRCITPYAEFRIPDCEENERKNQLSSRLLSESILHALETNPDLKNILVPVHYCGHWNLSIINKLNDSDEWRLITCETLSYAKMVKCDPLASIGLVLEGVPELVFESAHKALQTKLKPGFNYMEFKQYGDKGCGFTTSIFAEAILKGDVSIDDEMIYSDKDWSVATYTDVTKVLLRQLSEVQERIQDIQFGGGHSEDLELLNSKAADLLSNIEILEAAGGDVVLENNRSLSSSIELEALRRVQLAFKFEKTHKESVAATIGVLGGVKV